MKVKLASIVTASSALKSPAVGDVRLTAFRPGEPAR